MTALDHDSTWAGRVEVGFCTIERYRPSSQARSGPVRLRGGAERPTKESIGFLNREVVDACDASLYQTVRSEFPVLVPIGAKPLPGGIMPLVGESNGNAVSRKRPELLAESLLEFR